VFDAKPPLGVVAIFRNELSVDIRSGSELADVVDLTLFGAFRPNVPIDAVIAAHGRPEGERSQHGGTFYRYSQGPVAIEVAHLRAASVIGGAWEGWSVYAYPNRRPEAVFHQEVVGLLRNRPTINRVIVVASGKAARETIAASVMDGVIRDLQWSITPSVKVSEASR
jgi:hypothetical protein